MQQYHEPSHKNPVARIHRAKDGSYRVFSFRTLRTTIMSAEKFARFIKIGEVDWWKNTLGIIFIYPIDLLPKNS